MKKIVIAADSFKGSISSRRFAEVCRDAVLSVIPDCEVVTIPLGDGGEGTVEALISSIGATKVSIAVCDPLMRDTTALYGVSPDGATAIMEMAQASGLPLLSESDRNPMITSTYGTGQMILDALGRGCRNIMIGIGGSATNDGGTGMLQALGAVFLGADDKPLPAPMNGGTLPLIRRIDLSRLDNRLKDTRITVACDVDNPLCGPLGATHVFARQKGANDAMIEKLECGMCHYSRILSDATGRDVAQMSGAGAAGGLGGALAAALGARLMPGIEMVLDATGFDRQISEADLIITGEGRIDSQTLMGKTPFGVLSAAKKQGIPVIALGGSVQYSAELSNAGFAGIFSIQPAPVSLAEALDPQTASRNLADTTTQILKLLTSSGR